MTSKDFISKTIGVSATRERSCSSVFTDFQGVVYSYGYHYPLATIIDDMGFVNNRGYSSSTGKHIGWSFAALSQKLGYTNVYGVPLERGETLTKPNIIIAANREYARLTGAMDRKARKDTLVYSLLENNRLKMVQILDVLDNDICERNYVGGDKYHCYVHGYDVDIQESQFNDDSDISCEGFNSTNNRI